MKPPNASPKPTAARSAPSPTGSGVESSGSGPGRQNMAYVAYPSRHTASATLASSAAAASPPLKPAARYRAASPQKLAVGGRPAQANAPAHQANAVNGSSRASPPSLST